MTWQKKFKKRLFSSTKLFMDWKLPIGKKYLHSTEICFYGFFQTAWFLTRIPLILHLIFKNITYNLSVLLRTSHIAFWKNLTSYVSAITSHHLKIQSLSLEKDLTIGMFTFDNHFFLIINQKIGYPGIYP